METKALLVSRVHASSILQHLLQKSLLLAVGAPVTLVSGVVGATAAPGSSGLIPKYGAVLQLFVGRAESARSGKKT